MMMIIRLNKKYFFLKALFTAKCNDLICDLLTGQASRPYYMHGKHLIFDNSIITFSPAILLILPKNTIEGPGK